MQPRHTKLSSNFKKCSIISVLKFNTDPYSKYQISSLITQHLVRQKINLFMSNFSFLFASIKINFRFYKFTRFQRTNSQTCHIKILFMDNMKYILGFCNIVKRYIFLNYYFFFFFQYLQEKFSSSIGVMKVCIARHLNRGDIFLPLQIFPYFSHQDSLHSKYMILIQYY